jgi:Protein of unknown function (DUF3237)
VNFSNEGLSLWYGTPDAPAPGDTGVVPRRGASLIVGVRPANPTNSVSVRFRVDGGREQTLAGRELRTDFDRQVQYFGVTFPDFLQGSLVEYVPVLSSTGRQVPAPTFATRLPSKFQLAPPSLAAPPKAAPRALASPSTTRHFEAGLGFVASVAVQFSAPEFVGDTPAGARVNFFVEDGTFTGSGFKGTVTEHSSDHLLVRRDGMGLVRIRATFVAADGAKLDIESSGYVDFGPDGYRRTLAQDLPDRSAIVVTPLITTRHARYRWLSRVQCVGVGYTHLDVNQASYSVYAVSSKPSPAQPRS